MCLTIQVIEVPRLYDAVCDMVLSPPRLLDGTIASDPALGVAIYHQSHEMTTTRGLQPFAGWGRDWKEQQKVVGGRRVWRSTTSKSRS